jgi:outer membrane protein assembly factor BamE (lipoprotein component of BamABCDE complex)
MKKIITIALVAILLAACASTGNTALKNETSTTIATKITKGQTTQAQVRQMLGSPTSSDFTDSGNQIWRYSHAEATAMGRNFIPFVSMFSSGANVESKQLVVFFDKDGIVQNYSMEESKTETKQGIIRQ